MQTDFWLFTVRHFILLLLFDREFMYWLRKYTAIVLFSAFCDEGCVFKELNTSLLSALKENVLCFGLGMLFFSF